MYKNPFEKITNPYTIEAERDSVCMGDDCNAPHYVHLEYDPNQLLSEWMQSTVLGYVPNMKGCVWAVFSGKSPKRKLLGYLVGDAETDTYSVELAREDEFMGILSIKEIFCRYYYPSFFTSKKYLKLPTMLERVRLSVEG